MLGLKVCVNMSSCKAMDHSCVFLLSAPFMNYSSSLRGGWLKRSAPTGHADMEKSSIKGAGSEGEGVRNTGSHLSGKILALDQRWT